MSRGYGTSSGSRSCGKRSPRRIARRSRRRRGSTARGRVLDHSARSISTLHGLRAYARTRCFFSLSRTPPFFPYVTTPHPSSTSHLLYEDALDGAWDGSRVENEYTFRSENPYLGQADDLLQLGTELWERGELQQAILALEAAVQASRAQVAHKSRASLAQVSRTSRTRRAQVAHTSPTHKSHTSLTPVCPPIDHTSFPTPT